MLITVCRTLYSIVRSDSILHHQRMLTRAKRHVTCQWRSNDDGEGVVAIQLTSNGRPTWRDFPRLCSHKVTEARALPLNASPSGFGACSRPQNLSVYTKLTHTLHYTQRARATTLCVALGAYLHMHTAWMLVCKLIISIMHDKAFTVGLLDMRSTYCASRMARHDVIGFIHEMRRALWSGSRTAWDRVFRITVVELVNVISYIQIRTPLLGIRKHSYYSELKTFHQLCVEHSHSFAHLEQRNLLCATCICGICIYSIHGWFMIDSVSKECPKARVR